VSSEEYYDLFVKYVSDINEFKRRINSEFAPLGYTLTELLEKVLLEGVVDYEKFLVDEVDRVVYEYRGELSYFRISYQSAVIARRILDIIITTLASLNTRSALQARALARLIYRKIKKEIGTPHYIVEMNPEDLSTLINELRSEIAGAIGEAVNADLFKDQVFIYIILGKECPKCKKVVESDGWKFITSKLRNYGEFRIIYHDEPEYQGLVFSFLFERLETPILYLVSCTSDRPKIYIWESSDSPDPILSALDEYNYAFYKWVLERPKDVIRILVPVEPTYLRVRRTDVIRKVGSKKYQIITYIISQLDDKGELDINDIVKKVKSRFHTTEGQIAEVIDTLQESGVIEVKGSKIVPGTNFTTDLSELLGLK